MGNHPAYNILRLLETPGIGVVKTNAILSRLGAGFAPEDVRPFLSARQYEEFAASEEKTRQDWERLREMKVSGYAAGVDITTHRAALACGGTTTLVLCEGILHFTIKRDLKELWDWERSAAVSEFLPGIPWSVRNAMQRNRTIYALTSAMILIESSSRGGSMEAGRACLKMGTPLFAPVYAGMPETAVGNRELLQQGALELYKNSATNRANLTNVLHRIAQQEDPSRTETLQKSYPIDKPEAQLSLFEKKGGYRKEKRQTAGGKAGS